MWAALDGSDGQGRHAELGKGLNGYIPFYISIYPTYGGVGAHSGPTGHAQARIRSSSSEVKCGGKGLRLMDP